MCIRDRTRLGQKEPLHALYAAEKLNHTDRPTDGHRQFKSSDGAKKSGGLKNKYKGSLIVKIDQKFSQF